jgi:DNA-directed RNA polymerase sigma subunit (sigma70/sigma32)
MTQPGAGFRVRDEELAGPTQHLCRSPTISIPSVSSVREHGGEPTAQELARLLGVSPRVRVLERVDRDPVSLDELVAEDVMRHGDLIPAAPQAARRYRSASRRDLEGQR